MRARDRDETAGKEQGWRKVKRDIERGTRWVQDFIRDPACHPFLVTSEGGAGIVFTGIALREKGEGRREGQGKGADDSNLPSSQIPVTLLLLPPHSTQPCKLSRPSNQHGFSRNSSYHLPAFSQVTGRNNTPPSTSTVSRLFRWYYLDWTVLGSWSLGLH